MLSTPIVTWLGSPLQWTASRRRSALDGFLSELLVELRAEPRRAHDLAHELVVGHAGEVVVAARRDVIADLPLLLLELDVGLLLLVFQPLEQLGEAVAGGVLRREGDEEEPVPEVAELGEGDRVGVVEPLERRRPVE